MSLRLEGGGLPGVKVGVGEGTSCPTLYALADVARSRFELNGPLQFFVDGDEILSLELLERDDAVVVRVDAAAQMLPAAHSSMASDAVLSLTVSDAVLTPAPRQLVQLTGPSPLRLGSLGSMVRPAQLRPAFSRLP